MENSKASGVKALTAMFSERDEPIIRVKATASSQNVATKSDESRSNSTKETRPRGPKPPITQKPVLPKPLPRKPPRLKYTDPVLRKSLNSLNASENEETPSKNEIEQTPPISKSHNNVENVDQAKLLESTTIKSQSFDSLNTVCTNDSGISSTSRLDSIPDRNLPIDNKLYDLNILNDEMNISRENSNSSKSLNVSINKDAIKKELEKRLGSQTSLQSSNESLTNNKCSSNQYPRYKRRLLTELNFENAPPRKPMLPPDVHIAVFKQIDSDSPPPAPPRRLTKPTDSTDSPPELRPRKQITSTSDKTSYGRPTRLVPTRPSPPPPAMPKISLPNDGTSSPRSTTNDEFLSDNRKSNDRVSLIPEYTEEEELGDCALYDDTGINSDIPPPLPQKPSNSSSAYQHNLDKDNNNLPTDSYYQSPVIHILPSQLQSNDSHYSTPKEQGLTLKENKTRSRKEQKEREKKEKEAARIMKKYSLTGEEKALDFGFIKESAKGRRNDLSVKKGEQVVILRMENNPPGMWLVQNTSGKMGYVELTNIEVMHCRAISKSTDSNLDIEEDTYDDIDMNFGEEAIYEETC